MPILFRYATESDAEAVHNLIQAAFAEYIDTIAVPPGALSDTLEYTQHAISEGRTILAYISDVEFAGGEVAYNYAELAGTARYEPREDHLYIGRVAVHPDCRRFGVGKALMEYIEHVALTLGYSRLYLGTRASMPGNLAFYERLGYTIVKQEDHPRGPDLNVWYEKHLLKPETPQSLLNNLIAQLEDLPGAHVDRVTYCTYPYHLERLEYDDRDVPIVSLNGEAQLFFDDPEQIYTLRCISWTSNQVPDAAHSLSISPNTHFVPSTFRCLEVDFHTLWRRFLYKPIHFIDLLGWQGVPYICRIAFDTGSIYIGTGTENTFGNAANLLIATEEGFASMNLAPPDLLAHLTPNQSQESQIRNPKPL